MLPQRDRERERERCPTRIASTEVVNFHERPEAAVDHFKVIQSPLNEFRAKILRAKLRKDPKLEEQENQFKKFQDQFCTERRQGEEVNRQARAVELKGHFTEKGKSSEHNMTISDMIREEKTPSELERASMETIIKDKKYSNDLDIQDDNSSKLATYIKKSAKDLKIMEFSESKKLQLHLDRCQLCIENDNPCDLISMAEYTFLTIPPKA